MDVLEIRMESFTLNSHTNKAGKFIWNLVSMYGAAQEDSKAAFLCEMVNLAKDNPHPVLIGVRCLIC
jgi:hypothetical protein